MVIDLAAMEVLLTAIDADTNSIKTAVEILDNAISGNEMQVDVVASLPAGANTIGGVIIAAGSVVSGEIPPYSVVMGNPARVFYNREKTDFDKKQ